MPPPAKTPTVDETIAKAFDDFVSYGDKVRAASKHEKKKKEAQKVLEAKFEELQSDRMQLPDGRIIQRLAESRDMPAKPKHRQQWWKIFQAAE